MWRYIVDNPDVATDNGVVADGNASQYGSIRVYRHMVLDDGVSRYVQHIAVLIVLETLGS